MNDIEKTVITTFHSAMDLNNPVFSNYSKRSRSVNGICFPLSGKMIYNHNGSEVVSDRHHAVFIPKGATYTYSCIEEGRFPLINFDTAEGTAPSEFMVFEIDNADDYMHFFHELEKIALINPQNGHLKAIKIIYEILLLLHKTELKKESHTFESIRPAVKFLQNNFSTPSLTNKVLAQKAMISEVYFRKLFKENFGVSPKQYIQDLRISKAKSLLQGNVCPTVSAVAEAVGFSNVYQFSAAFKKNTGFTPTEYMKKFKTLNNF